MSVKLNTRQVGDVTVVDVAGRITLGEGSSALRDTVRDVLADDRRRDARVLLVVRVAAVSLVLREVGRVGRLADVVEERAGAGKEGVGANGVARVLGEPAPSVVSRPKRGELALSPEP